MISGINSFSVPKISFGKLKISEDKETQNAIGKLGSASSLMMGSFSYIDDDSERDGYDIVLTAEADEHNNIHFKADAYANVKIKIGSHEDMLKTVDKGYEDYDIYRDNRAKLTRFTYNFTTEIKKRLEQLHALDTDA